MRQIQHYTNDTRYYYTMTKNRAPISACKYLLAKLREIVLFQLELHRYCCSTPGLLGKNWNIPQVAVKRCRAFYYATCAPFFFVIPGGSRTEYIVRKPISLSEIYVEIGGYPDFVCSLPIGTAIIWCNHLLHPGQTTVTSCMLLKR